MTAADPAVAPLASLATAVERDYPMNPLMAAFAADMLGIPVRVCYATPPDRLTACALAHGHRGRHNARHDGTGRGWA